jgi:hypothetical protein
MVVLAQIFRTDLDVIVQTNIQARDAILKLTCAQIQIVKMEAYVARHSTA